MKTRQIKRLAAVGLLVTGFSGGCNVITIGGPLNLKDSPDYALQNLGDESRSSKQSWVKSCITPSGDPNERDRLERTPLMVAAAFGPTEFITRAIAAGADVSARDQAQNTPLMYAASYGNGAAIQILVAAGADLEAHDKWDYTALYFAASSEDGTADCVRALIVAGSDLDSRGSVNRSPLAVAASEQGDQMRLQVLLRHNRDDEDEQASQARLNDALVWAALGERADAIAALLEAGADLQTMDTCWGTPLHAAARSDDPTVLSALIEAGADLESHDHTSGGTPLHVAVCSPSFGTTKALIDLGADTNARNRAGATPLMVGATTVISNRHRFVQDSEKVLACIDALLATGAELEAKDDKGSTALIWAVGAWGDDQRSHRLHCS